MRILAFTDMHGSEKAFRKIKKKAKNADLILNCGDFTIFQQKLLYWLKKFEALKKPMLVVPGNHEMEDDLLHACRKLQYVKCMIDSGYVQGSLIVLAAEGNGFALQDPRFEKVAKGFRRILAQKENNGRSFILMTHAPPHGTSLDSLMDGHTGNKSIRDFIRQTQPLYSFHGHIEENSCKKDKIGRTIVVNPGPEGRLFTV